MQQFTAWLVAFMMAKAPLDRPHFIPEAKETVEAGEARYQQIATDIAEVVATERPLFKGDDGKVRTSALLLSIMFHESGFRRDVDLGLGKLAKGDHGNSVCMMQINVGDRKTYRWNTVKDRLAQPTDPASEVQEGWTAKEVLADRKKCIRAGLRIMRISFAACPKLPQKDWLRVYASGSCDAGARESASRMGLASRWYSTHKPSFNDTAIVLDPTPDYPSPLMYPPAIMADRWWVPQQNHSFHSQRSIVWFED